MQKCNHSNIERGEQMDEVKNTAIKNASEIGMLVKQLNPCNQSYILNTINAFLFSQNVEKNKNNQEKDGSKL